MKVSAILLVAVLVAMCSAHPPLSSVAVTQVSVSRHRRADQEDGVGVDIHREKGVGTVVKGDGQRTWTSGDGKTDVRAHGEWSRVVNGPGAGKPHYNAGVSIRHRF